jgi:diketogulonate reductase-like aldo/keto reductase
MSIKHEFILNDGKAIPWLAIGTGTALYGKDAENAIKQAILAGINHLDGAQTYRNEQSLGAGVVASGVPREKLFITTKLMKVPEGKTVTQTLEESLTKLQTKYVDLFLIHAPFEHEDILAVWKSMEETQKAGLARSIGVSNFRIKDIQVVLAGGSVVPAVNQVCYRILVLSASARSLTPISDRIPPIHRQSYRSPCRVLPQ